MYTNTISHHLLCHVTFILLHAAIYLQGVRMDTGKVSEGDHGDTVSSHAILPHSNKSPTSASPLRASISEEVDEDSG